MMARSLLQLVSPVGPKMTVSEAFEVFTANPQTVALPIVEGTRPLGLVTRTSLVEAFAKPFMRELCA